MASKKKRDEIPPNTPSGGFAAKGIDLTFEKGLPASPTESRLAAIGAPFTIKRSGRNRRFVACLCACGMTLNVDYYQFLNGKTKSCGCYRSDRASEAGRRIGFKRTHGESVHAGNSTEYRIWSGIIQRCCNPNDAAYGDYGGRGISICERWRNSYEAFLEDVGRRPAALSLDRWPNQNGNYEPGNVRWATAQQQQRNKRDNRLLTWDYRTQSVSAWSEEKGWPRTIIDNRLRKGWDVEKIFTTKPRLDKRRRAL